MPLTDEDRAEIKKAADELAAKAAHDRLEETASDITRAIGAWIDFKIEASQGRKVYYDFGERQERAVREEILRALGGTVRPSENDD